MDYFGNVLELERTDIGGDGTVKIKVTENESDISKADKIGKTFRNRSTT